MPALGIAFSPCPAGLDPASHPVKQVGTQRVALNILFHSLKIKCHEEVNLGGYPQNHYRRGFCRSGCDRCQCLRVIGKMPFDAVSRDIQLIAQHCNPVMGRFSHISLLF